MKPLKIEEINKRYSPTWVACNDNSKSKSFRDEILSKYGGEFIKDGRYLKWQEIQPIKEVYVPKRLLKFLDSSGKCVEIDNMTEYCQQHKLSKAAMYALLTGGRKSHKGYTALVVPKADVIVPEDVSETEDIPKE